MRCEEMAETIPDLVAGRLSEEELARLRRHLAVCAGCADEAAAMEELWRALGEMPEEEPSPELESRFARRLAREIALERGEIAALEPRERTGRPARRWSPSGSFAAIAASIALVAVGALLGTELSRRRDAAEMGKLREDVRSLNETVTVALLSQSSAVKRLEGVAYGREVSGADDKVADALFDTLLHDPNVNVRLAALDALKPRANRPDLRPRLVAAVPDEHSALVQLSLLSMLLESGTPAAEHDLRQLLDNPRLDPVVRGYLRDRLGRRI
jgi:Putative zinc-finger/HEAT repeats